MGVLLSGFKREGFKTKSYFIGKEVEHTKFYDLKTLFIVDVLSVNKIIDLIKENNVDHVYLGANKSTTKDNLFDLIDLMDELSKYIYVTIDIPYALYEKEEINLSSNDNVNIILTSPHNAIGDKNIYLKIDNDGFFEKNDKIWVIELNSPDGEYFATYISEYEDDE